MSAGRRWQSLIRFKNRGGQVKFGEPRESLKTATVWEGLDICNMSPTDEEDEVVEFKLPNYPAVFHKSKNSITGPYSPISMHPKAGNVDYENELCVIVSKDAKDVTENDAHSYILAYTVGNDVSSREWQVLDRSGGQFCYAKNFDGFCPIGPKLVAPALVEDPQNLKIETRRNGNVVQKSNTSDMIFGVYELISFLSQGTTIPAGTLIMTGTPPGVAMFASNPPNFLKKGEVVECEIEKLGSTRNEFV